MNSKARLAKIKKQRNAAYDDLSWQLAERLFEIMGTPLEKRCKEQGLDSSATIGDIKKSGSDYSALFEDLASELSVYIKLAANLPEDQRNKAYKKAYDCIPIILNMLKENKRGSEKIRIEKVVFDYVFKLNQFIIAIQKISKDFTQDNIDVADAILNLILYLKDHCWAIMPESSPGAVLTHQLNFIAVISNHYIFLVHAYEEDKNRCKQYLTDYKKFILEIEDAGMKANRLEWYYLTKSILANNENNYRLAIIYHFKAITQAQILFDAKQTLTLFKNQIDLTLNLIDSLREHTLLDDAIDYLLTMLDSLNTFSEGHLANKEDKNLLSALHEELAKLEQLQKIAVALKYGKAIGKIGAGLFTTYYFTTGEEEKRAILIIEPEDSQHAKALKEICVANSFSLYHFLDIALDNRVVAIDNLWNVKKKTLEKAVINWMDVIKNNVDTVLQSTETQSNESSATKNETNAAPPMGETTPAIIAPDPLLPSPTIPLFIECTNQPALNHQTLSITNTKPLITTGKKIVFDAKGAFIYNSDGSGNVFRFYSQHAKTYGRITEELKRKLKAEDPAALKELEKICARGQVLGNSKGKQGLIISGNRFPEMPNSKKPVPVSQKRSRNQKANPTQLYVKVKHCKRGWRAFGESEEFLASNGKNYRLFTINSWTYTHKKTASEPEKKYQKNIKKTN